MSVLAGGAGCAVEDDAAGVLPVLEFELARSLTCVGGGMGAACDASPEAGKSFCISLPDVCPLGAAASEAAPLVVAGSPAAASE